jgi:hypothetical protein
VGSLSFLSLCSIAPMTSVSGVEAVPLSRCLCTLMRVCSHFFSLLFELIVKMVT